MDPDGPPPTGVSFEVPIAGDLLESLNFIP